MTARVSYDDKLMTFLTQTNRKGMYLEYLQKRVEALVPGEKVTDMEELKVENDMKKETLRRIDDKTVELELEGQYPQAEIMRVASGSVDVVIGLNSRETRGFAITPADPSKPVKVRIQVID